MHLNSYFIRFVSVFIALYWVFSPVVEHSVPLAYLLTIVTTMGIHFALNLLLKEWHKAKALKDKAKH
jgi:hypothetical protein